MPDAVVAMHSCNGVVGQDLMDQPHALHRADLAIEDGDPGALLPAVLDNSERFA